MGAEISIFRSQLILELKSTIERLHLIIDFITKINSIQ